MFAEGGLLRRSTVQALRLNAGKFPDDPLIAALVAELSAASSEFAELWTGHGVGRLTRAFKAVVHPVAGRIELTCQTFDVHDARGQQLLVGTPEPGSAAEKALMGWSQEPRT